MRSVPPFVSIDQAQTIWRALNDRYFRSALPPIAINWSQRLTASAGMFVSQVGPRSRRDRIDESHSTQRVIRLSIPLLCDQPEREIIGTLAHEMIHQWQFDALKRRPNHGRDFRRMMAMMNRDGLGITISHALDEAVQALAQYAWRCQQCGREYRRQRRTIRPSRHRCGDCRGKLREIAPAAARHEAWTLSATPMRASSSSLRPVQLAFDFAIS